MNRQKRRIDIAVIAVLLVAVAAGAFATGTEEADSATDEPITLTWMLEEHPNYAVSENWAFFQEIERRTGVEIEFQPISQSSYQDKKRVVLSTRNLPDIMVVNRDESQQYGMQGAFLPLHEYIDEYAPNLVSVFEAKPQMRSGVTTTDGSIYGFPIESTSEIYPYIGWMYRADVFEEHGIPVPQTAEDFYDALVQLKDAYPDSIPFTFRMWSGDGSIMAKFANQYGVRGYTWELIEYHPDSDDIVFMPSLPMFEQMVSFVHRLYEAGVMDANYPIATKQQVNQYMTTGQSFVCYDWLNRVNQYNTEVANAETPIEGYEVAHMLPWVPEGGPGWVENGGILGPTVNVLSAEIEYPEEAVQFFDFFYSPEGAQLTRWGIEGDTFEYNAAGGRQYTDKIQVTYVDNPDALPWPAFGLGYNNIQMLADSRPEDTESGTPEILEYFSDVRANDRIAPSPFYYSETEEEAAFWRENYARVQEHYVENIDKFVIGQRPMSEWDDFIAEFDDLPVDELIEIRRAQHERVTE